MGMKELKRYKHATRCAAMHKISSDDSVLVDTFSMDVTWFMPIPHAECCKIQLLCQVLLPVLIRLLWQWPKSNYNVLKPHKAPLPNGGGGLILVISHHNVASDQKPQLTNCLLQCWMALSRVVDTYLARGQLVECGVLGPSKPGLLGLYYGG